MKNRILSLEKKSNDNLRYIIDFLAGKYKLEGKSVLDVGCGIGTKTAALFEYKKPKKIIGIDINIKEIERAKELFPEIDYRCEGILDHKEKADVIIMMLSLHHIADLKRALKHISDLLNDDGLLIIQEADKYSAMLRKGQNPERKYTRDGLCSLLRKNGFRIIESKYYVPYLLRKFGFLLRNPLMNALVGQTYYVYAKKK